MFHVAKIGSHFEFSNICPAMLKPRYPIKKAGINHLCRQMVGYLGMRALASSALSGQRLANAASSNLCNFFCVNKLKSQK